MTELVFCSAAAAEYTMALAWYAERSLEAALRFEADFEADIQKIAASPDRFPQCDERTVSS